MKQRNISLTEAQDILIDVIVLTSADLQPKYILHPYIGYIWV